MLHALVTRIERHDDNEQQARRGVTVEAEASTYRAFLIRLWTPGHSSEVKASITDVATGDIRIFSDLADLHAWLDSAVDDARPSS